MIESVVRAIKDLGDAALSKEDRAQVRVLKTAVETALAKSERKTETKTFSAAEFTKHAEVETAAAIRDRDVERVELLAKAVAGVGGMISAPVFVEAAADSTDLAETVKKSLAAIAETVKKAGDGSAAPAPATTTPVPTAAPAAEAKVEKGAKVVWGLDLSVDQPAA